MFDASRPANLCLAPPAALALSLCLALAMIVSAVSPAEAVPQAVSPSQPGDTPSGAMPTPTAAPEAEALLGTWADGGSFVLELSDDGAYTLSFSRRREPDTGTWALQDDGRLDLDGQSYAGAPHGNFLLLDTVDGTGTLRILQRVGEDGSLLPYESADASEVPPMDASTVLAITIADYWTGLSEVAPIEADFRLQPATDSFSGMADFSVAAYTAAITSSVPISVPLEVIDELLALLESTPLETGEYKPVFNHTDDFPAISIIVDGREVDIGFASTSQGSRHIPWRVEVGRHHYVTYADTPLQALDLLDPYLARDVQDALFDLAEQRDQ